MKKLLNLIASAIIVVTPVVSVVSCNSSDDNYTITIQQVSKEHAPTGTEDLSKIYQHTIDNVLNKVKTNDKYKNLTKFKFKLVDSPGDNYFVDKIDNGNAQYTSKDMPDVFRTQLSQQNTIDFGAFLPLDKDTDSLGQSGKDFIQSIGLSGKDTSTATTLGSNQKYWFNDAAITRSKAIKKNTTELHTFIIPTSITAAGGFFFDKSPDALREYQNLNIGQIVYANGAKTGQIVNPDEIAKITPDNIDNYTFQFGMGVAHGQDMAKDARSYVSLNQLVVASERLYADSVSGKYSTGQKYPLNLMAMGDCNYLHSRFLEQISAMGLVNSTQSNGITWDQAAKVKDPYVGDSWQKSLLNTTYFDDLQHSNDLHNILPAGLYKKAASGSDTGTVYGSIFSNANFTSSAEAVVEQIFNYNVFESRLAKGLTNINWEDWWTQARESDGRDPILSPIVANVVRNIDNDKVSERSLLYCLGNSGYKQAAVNMFSNVHWNPDKIPSDKWAEPKYKDLDFAPIYQLGLGNDKLTAPEGENKFNGISYNTSTDLNTRSVIDGSKLNSAAIDNLGGGGIAVNNKIASEKTYKDKLALIRLFIKEFTNEYLANVNNKNNPTGVDQFRQIYDDGDQITPIQVENTDGKSFSSATSIFKNDVDNKLIWNNNMPQTNRMKLNEMLSVEKMDESYTMESGIPTKQLNLDNGKIPPYDTLLGNVIKSASSSLATGGDFWKTYATAINLDNLAVNVSDGNYYKLLEAAVKLFMSDVVTKLTS